MFAQKMISKNSGRLSRRILAPTLTVLGAVWAAGCGAEAGIEGDEVPLSELDEPTLEPTGYENGDENGDEEEPCEKDDHKWKKKKKRLDCENARPSIEELWPPNHKFQSVSIEGLGNADIDITAVLQDEVTERNEGDKCPDAENLGGDTVDLRSERFGSEDGRIYHIFFTAEDDYGNECEGHVTVCVPHDQGPGDNCIDSSPPLYDSTVCAGAD